MDRALCGEPSSDASESARPAVSVADVLNAAADLIEPEGRWTQGTWARSSVGDTDPIDDAICWCAYGAIYQVCGRKWTPEANAGMRLLCGVLRLGATDPMGSIGLWNDKEGRTQAEVVAALREAARPAAGQSPSGKTEDGTRTQGDSNA